MLKWSDDLVAFLNSHVSQEDFHISMDAFVACNDFTRAAIAARRAKTNNRLTFGLGTHFCLGNQLARLELSLTTSRVLG